MALTTGLALAAWTAPAAAAEPTTTAAPPEVPPDPGVVFTNDPSIVDPHPMPVESWSRIGAGDVLALNFTTGTPECYGVNALVQETAENVTVELRGGTLTRGARAGMHRDRAVRHAGSAAAESRSATDRCSASPEATLDKPR